ncbi:copper homeostasis protein CutC [Rossellomorea marisflavi]|uniref:PF03932 family protein CutC n=1 Tax=Rossellomorea marisflavi TaxID=189381 RepID=A0A0M0G0B7_9BACI|nr:copper homeostasis protein CutC [Rossellomorea marisflavi]KON83259.1 copper homeostasis protein CutC [Rossellomorea marisflavi]
MLKEVCVENFTKVPEAIEKGARRVELCDNLAVGGTTVSPGVARVTLDYCRSRNVKVMSMIRPRGGDFVYNVDEIEIMKQDIIHLKELRTDGVVFGCLTQDGWIDEEAMIMLLEAATGLEVVFHMAFDAITAESQLKAIDWLAEHGVHRILTHGGPSDTKIEDNVDRLKAYIEYSDKRITILPGGGITHLNLPAIESSLSINEAHGTRILEG